MFEDRHLRLETPLRNRWKVSSLTFIHSLSVSFSSGKVGVLVEALHHTTKKANKGLAFDFDHGNAAIVAKTLQCLPQVLTATNPIIRAANAQTDP